MKKCVFIGFVFLALLSCETMEKIGQEITFAINSIDVSERRVDDRYWNPDQVITTEEVDYLNITEKNVIIELNKARTNPAKYAELYIEPMRSYYTGEEGVSALNECVRVLSNTKPVGILEPSIGLSKAASDHAADQSNTGKTGHTGSDGSSFKQRIKRYGISKSYSGENIAYGNSGAKQIVIQLLIDDGVPSRGHRKNILNKHFKQVGVAYNTHMKYSTVTVMDFASNYIEK